MSTIIKELNIDIYKWSEEVDLLDIEYTNNKGEKITIGLYKPQIVKILKLKEEFKDNIKGVILTINSKTPIVLDVLASHNVVTKI